MKGGFNLNRDEIFAFIGLIVLLATTIFVIHLTTSNQTNPPAENNEQNENESDHETSKETKDVYWGVDSASYTDENIYQCVSENFGQPKVWGRYIGAIEGVSAGLDTDEVHFLHDNDAYILIIYNHFDDATGYDHGAEEAEKAIQLAEDLKVPDGVAIFGDIEPTYDVDSDFINGWYETIMDSEYKPGIYGVFNAEGDVLAAFLNTEDATQENTILWTAYPQKEITSKDEAPNYAPQGPDNAKLFGWQYAIDAKQCNIDTNLFSKDMLDYLWKPTDD